MGRALYLPVQVPQQNKKEQRQGNQHQRCNDTVYLIEERRIVPRTVEQDDQSDLIDHEHIQRSRKHAEPSHMSRERIGEECSDKQKQ
jgi:hypothetical protein